MAHLTSLQQHSHQGAEAVSNSRVDPCSSVSVSPGHDQSLLLLPDSLDAAAHRPAGWPIQFTCADAERTLFVEEHHWLFIQDQRENLRYVYAIPAARNATDLDQVLHVRLCISAYAYPLDSHCQIYPLTSCLNHA